MEMENAGSVPVVEKTEDVLYADDLTIRSKMSFLTCLKDKLKGSNRENIFKDTCFGYWLDIPYTDNEPPLVNLILQTQIPVDPDVYQEHDPLVYNVGGLKLEFGREQFCLVTGFPFGPIDWSLYSSDEEEDECDAAMDSKWG